MWKPISEPPEELNTFVVVLDMSHAAHPIANADLWLGAEGWESGYNNWTHWAPLPEEEE